MAKAQAIVVIGRRGARGTYTKRRHPLSSISAGGCATRLDQVPPTAWHSFGSPAPRRKNNRGYEELQEVPKEPAKMAVEGACWYDRNVEGLPAPTGDDQYVRFGEP